MNQGGVTLKEIARQAGCSITVVSKVLNGARGSAGAGADTRARILLLAQQLGYSPNFHARALQEGRSRTLGLVCRLHDASHFDNDFWVQLIRGVESSVRGLRHDLLVVGPTDEGSELTRGVEHLRQKRIDALVVPADIYRAELTRLVDPDLPIVVAGDAPDCCYPSVAVDMAPGCVEALRHLAGLGHREIQWVPLRIDGKAGDSRRDEQMRRAAEVAGVRLVPLILDLPPDWGRESAEASIETVRVRYAEYLSRELPGSAVVAYNERLALGINGALSEAGVRVPRDVSLLAFGDIFAHVATPPLTVVSFRLPELGRRAAELGLRLAGDERPEWSPPPYRELIPAKLVVRRSTDHR